MENVFDKVDFDNANDVVKQSGEVDKTDIVKRIESIDVHNITQEDIDFMVTTIQDNLRADAYINEELIEQIPEHMTLLPGEEFVAKLLAILSCFTL